MQDIKSHFDHFLRTVKQQTGLQFTLRVHMFEISPPTEITLTQGSGKAARRKRCRERRRDRDSRTKCVGCAVVGFTDDFGPVNVDMCFAPRDDLPDYGGEFRHHQQMVPSFKWVHDHLLKPLNEECAPVNRDLWIHEDWEILTLDFQAKGRTPFVTVRWLQNNTMLSTEHPEIVGHVNPVESVKLGFPSDVTPKLQRQLETFIKSMESSTKLSFEVKWESWCRPAE